MFPVSAGAILSAEMEQRAASIPAEKLAWEILAVTWKTHRARPTSNPRQPHQGNSSEMGEGTQHGQIYGCSDSPYVLHSKLILLEQTFSLVSGPLLLLASVALKFLH
jgi:hypothetical protein